MPQSFERQVLRAMSAGDHGHMRPVIEKELFHYDILFALDQAGLLTSLTFQGGTSLRLCHGAPRFSEDLDFSGGKDFSGRQLMALKDCIESYMGDRYGLEVSVKEPNELRVDPQYAGIRVDKWQISITTAPDHRNMPRQRIKLDVANVPSYTREPLALGKNYEFLPDGYLDMFVMTETKNEIMADKLVSLVDCRSYVRNRDIWDLRWLAQQGAKPALSLVTAKLADYSVENYLANLDVMVDRLDDIVTGDRFQDEMRRFIPINVQERTLRKQGFNAFLSGEVKGLLRQIGNELENSWNKGSDINHAFTM